MNPTNSVPLDSSQARQVLRLLDTLEEQDDVQQVYANAEIPDDVLDAVS
jgi:transcriptional/translational regulatory protein YebC/TACO1